MVQSPTTIAPSPTSSPGPAPPITPAQIAPLIGQLEDTTSGDTPSTPRADHYHADYLGLNAVRLASYRQQLAYSLQSKPTSALIIGIGDGIIERILKRADISVTTLDIQSDLNPDVHASVTEIPLADRSFDFVTKSPPAAALLKQAAGVAKGSGVPNKEKVGQVTADQITEIVKVKMADLNARDVDHARRMIEGTARSMGLTVEG